jgi:hypothetical protein
VMMMIMMMMIMFIRIKTMNLILDIVVKMIF